GQRRTGVGWMGWGARARASAAEGIGRVEGGFHGKDGGVDSGHVYTSPPPHSIDTSAHSHEGAPSVHVNMIALEYMSSTA
ncbi:unnamed protein product, partial [Mycena citricolor]